MRDLWKHFEQAQYNRWSLFLDLDERIQQFMADGSWRDGTSGVIMLDRNRHVFDTLRALKQQEMRFASHLIQRDYRQFLSLRFRIYFRKKSLCMLAWISRRSCGMNYITFRILWYDSVVCLKLILTWVKMYFVAIPVTSCQIVSFSRLFFNDRVVADNHSFATVKRVILYMDYKYGHQGVNISRLLSPWRENYQLQQLPLLYCSKCFDFWIICAE